MRDEVPVESVLVDWVKRMRNFVRDENQDLVIPISGDTGDGKSTLALILGAMFDPQINADTLATRISWNAERHMRLAKRADRYEALILDEGEGLFSRDAMKGENRRFAKFLYECRKLNLIHILIFPEWKAVDSTVKGFRAEWRIQVKDKGEGIVLRRKGDSEQWGKVFKFEWPPLEGLPLWDEYEKLAYRAAKGLEIEPAQPDGDGEEEKPFVVRLAREVDARLKPLVGQIRDHAGLEEQKGELEGDP